MILHPVLRCPSCGKKVKGGVETTRHFQAEIIRYCVCKKCGYRFSTREPVEK